MKNLNYVATKLSIFFSATYLTNRDAIKGKTEQEKQKKLGAKIAAFALISHLEKNFGNLTISWIGRRRTNFDWTNSSEWMLNEDKDFGEISISRFHYMMISNAAGLRILVDLGSANGTIVSMSNSFQELSLHSSYQAHLAFAKEIFNCEKAVEISNTYTSENNLSPEIQQEMARIVSAIMTKSKNIGMNFVVQPKKGEQDKTAIILQTTDECFSWIPLPIGIDYDVIFRNLNVTYQSNPHVIVPAKPLTLSQQVAEEELPATDKFRASQETLRHIASPIHPSRGQGVGNNNIVEEEEGYRFQWI